MEWFCIYMENDVRYGITRNREPVSNQMCAGSGQRGAVNYGIPETATPLAANTREAVKFWRDEGYAGASPHEKSGRHTVSIKVIDIFGNDTMMLVPVNIA